MRKIKDMRLVAFFKTKGYVPIKMKRVPSFKDSNKEILEFYFDISDEEYDMLSTKYYTSEVLEFEQNLDCLKMLIFKHTNNKED